MNTPEKLLKCLEDLEPRIELPKDVMNRARKPIERMLEMSESVGRAGADSAKGA